MKGSKYIPNTKKAAQPGGTKSMKMGTDDLKEIIKSAVKEAMGGEEDPAVDDPAAEEAVPADGVTAEDVLSVVEQAVEAVTEKHKALKEAGQDDTGITAEYGDRLVTLSTCSYHTSDGRFVVVGRQKAGDRTARKTK